LSALDPREELAERLGLTQVPPIRFSSPEELRVRLAQHDYLSSDAISSVTFLADRLAKPVLVEGPAGTGKTALAKAVADSLGARLIRLQCYEGLDESKALYEWNYRKQLLRIQAGRPEGSAEVWAELEEDIFAEEFLLTRPLLEAITASDPVVLLIDEVDRVELETEALLLEILSEYQVSIPELGTLKARQIPMVFLTSLAEQIAQVVRTLRLMDLKKSPSVSETLDWARTLVILGRDELGEDLVVETLHILLKYQSDIEKATRELLGRAS
jgi:MoxR-like ATPase